MTGRTGHRASMLGRGAAGAASVRAARWLAVVALAAGVLSPCRASVGLAHAERAEELRKEGKLEEAERLAEQVLQDEDVSVRASATGVLARIRLRRGQVAEATFGLAQSARLHEQAGEPEAALRDELALVYVNLYQGRRFAAARAALARADVLSAATRSGRPGVLYFQGMLAYETGDLRTAVAKLRECLSSGEAAGDTTYRVDALEQLALMLLLLGKSEEGESLLREAEPLALSANPCVIATLWTNVAWFRLHARGPDGVAELLDRALGLLGDRCVDRSAHAHALTDYAVLRTLEGDAAGARRKLEEARRQVESPDGSLSATWMDIEGRLALRAGRPEEALASYELLSERARAGLLPISEWRGALGRARALADLGRDEEAGAAFEEAEAILARSALLVPGADGRAGFLGQLNESARAAVGFFLTRDPARAARIARHAIARASASVQWRDRVAGLQSDERARWEEAVFAYREGRSALESGADDSWKLTRAELAQAIAARHAADARLQAGLDAAIASLFKRGRRPRGDASRLRSPPSSSSCSTPSTSGLAVLAVTDGDVEAVSRSSPRPS
ncbi:MAG: hypothetical protein R3B70_39325 [Polyangiaceae bacterium]